MRNLLDVTSDTPSSVTPLPGRRWRNIEGGGAVEIGSQPPGVCSGNDGDRGILRHVAHLLRVLSLIWTPACEHQL